VSEPSWGWSEEKPAAEYARIDGIEFRIGDAVRLHPRAKADVFDIALAGQSARIQSIEHYIDR